VMISLGAFLGGNDDHVDDPKPEADAGDAS